MLCTICAVIAYHLNVEIYKGTRKKRVATYFFLLFWSTFDQFEMYAAEWSEEKGKSWEIHEVTLALCE